ncbi:MAG: hypothetical protein JWN22_2876 [Nocardioides sp.]|nr:hypothetical protein [Nocardioides sp.]
MLDRGIEAALAAYVARLGRLHLDRDWPGFGGQFTPDAVYRRPRGRDAVGPAEIAGLVRHILTRFPGTRLASTQVTWQVVDRVEQTALFEVRHELRDPGDGSEHAACTTSLLTYAGGGLWSGCHDMHSPRAYEEMTRGWLRAAERHSPLLRPTRRETAPPGHQSRSTAASSDPSGTTVASSSLTTVKATDEE